MSEMGEEFPEEMAKQEDYSIPLEALNNVKAYFSRVAKWNLEDSKGYLSLAAQRRADILFTLSLVITGHQKIPKAFYHAKRKKPSYKGGKTSNKSKILQNAKLNAQNVTVEQLEQIESQFNEEQNEV